METCWGSRKGRIWSWWTAPPNSIVRLAQDTGRNRPFRLGSLTVVPHGQVDRIQSQGWKRHFFLSLNIRKTTQSLWWRNTCHHCTSRECMREKYPNYSYPVRIAAIKELRFLNGFSNRLIFDIVVTCCKCFSYFFAGERRTPGFLGNPRFWKLPIIDVSWILGSFEIVHHPWMVGLLLHQLLTVPPNILLWERTIRDVNQANLTHGLVCRQSRENE